MRINELTKEQFLSTFDPPMRFIDKEDDSSKPVNIGDYVEECIAFFQIPTNRKKIDIHYVYMNDKKDFCHVLLNWGKSNVYLIIITKPEAQKIHGHYLLDLNIKYGLYDCVE